MNHLSENCSADSLSCLVRASLFETPMVSLIISGETKGRLPERLASRDLTV